MAHLQTKTTHKFTCDLCGLAAGEHAYEAEALAMARSVAKMQGWTQSHPGWGFRCPSCQPRKDRPMPTTTRPASEE